MTENLLPIGSFARVSGLTIKALRHYAELGLLEPACVDLETGYRYYTLAQARRADAIRRLRRLDLPLDEVEAALDASPDALRDLLAAHRGRMEERAADLRWILGELTALIDGKEPLVPDEEDVTGLDMELTQVPEEHAIVVREGASLDDMSTLVPKRIDQVRAYLAELGVRPVGPPVCVCPFADERGMLTAETGWLVADDVPGRGRFTATTMPATRAVVMTHHGPYEELSSSYRLLSEAMEAGGLRAAGDPREIYVTDPATVPDPQDYETRIVWPVGPEGDLDRSRDHVTRRAESEARGRRR